ncbi:hypothetical protein AO843_20995 [Lysinibacillus sp. ZYM-1]|nr:hypothetical protein AO843_20995 [Lysinibacillus sp. ZYM-1]
MLFYRGRLISFNDVVSELDIASIRNVLISDTREQSHYIKSEEIEQLISILNSLSMKNKLIPNRPAFSEDAVIIVSSADQEKSFTIMLDYERNIIGINQYHKNMKQYILEDDSDLFLFVQSYLK